MRIRTPHDVAALARGRRLDLGWTQTELAGRAGVSRKWVSDFETGKTSVALGVVLRVLDALELILASAEVAPPAKDLDVDRHLDRFRRQR